MTRESTITANILAALNAIEGCVAWKNHGGPYGHAGLPDLSIVYHGLACYLEVKRPGQKPTAIQQRFMETLENAGAHVAIVHTTEEALAAIQGTVPSIVRA